MFGFQKLIYSLPILPPTIVGIKPIYESISNQSLKGGNLLDLILKTNGKVLQKLLSLTLFVIMII